MDDLSRLREALQVKKCWQVCILPRVQKPTFRIWHSRYNNSGTQNLYLGGVMSEIRLMEYQGKYRLEQGNMGKDREGNEKWWPDKVKQQVWNKEKHAFEFEEKNSNLKMKLGSYEATQEQLASWQLQLDELEAKRLPDIPCGIDRQQVPLDSVPF
jgi:hypothetical protein